MASPSLADFDWPCDRRDAHGPHFITCGDINCAGYECQECPGVSAHPLTQIGGNYR